MPPLGSSTVVSARRTFSAGIDRSRSITAPSLESWLTSAAIARLMRPSLMTTGLKVTLTPNVFQLTAICPSWAAIGTGNSPPARNFAVSPETAVRLGSASVRTRPVPSSFSTRRPSERGPGPQTASPSWITLVKVMLVLSTAVGTLTPRRRMASRCISATCTLSSTCSLVPTASMLTTASLFLA